MTVGLEDKGLHDLSPAKGSTKVRKRVGRGPGSGTGKTSGRGQKGQKSRSGGGPRPGFEGGQMPIYMRISKLRGSNKKMSMPMGPFRTHTIPVNVGQLAQFEAGTTVDAALLKQAGVLRHTRHPVKVLGEGELTVKLTVIAGGFSAQAREKIEAAGGTCQLLEGPAPHGRQAVKLEKQAAYEASKGSAAPKAEKAAKAPKAAKAETTEAPATDAPADAPETSDEA
ncbi:MAG: ribosomal protein [Thermoleophilia bacterium]|nr:ribosomal protein [Thermoleophilia bacterium]